MVQSGDAGGGLGVTRGDGGIEPAQPKRINTPRLEHTGVPFVNLHCLTILDLLRTESRTDLEDSGGCDARGKARGCFFSHTPPQI